MDLAPFPHVELLSVPFGRELLQELGLRGLHCGSGRNLKPGWLNTDRLHLEDEEGHTSTPGQLVCLDGDHYYLEHDATRPFPLEDECFEWAFAEHFVEHLRPEQAIGWLREVRRVLRPGGHVRLSTPDLRRYLRGYFDSQGRFFTEHRRRLLAMGLQNVPPRRAWMVNQIFNFWGHQWIYDLAEVQHLAAQAGFLPNACTECRFRQGRLAEVADLDLAMRGDESLYVELIRN